MRERIFYGGIMLIVLMLVNVAYIPEAKPAEWDKAAAAARREGRLVIYSTGGADLKALFSENMKEKFGVQVEFVSAKGAELAEKVSAERRAGLYLEDIFIGGGTTLVTTLIPAGIPIWIRRRCMFSSTAPPWPIPLPSTATW